MNGFLPKHVLFVCPMYSDLLTQETREQRGRIESDRRLNNANIALKSVFPAIPPPVKLGIGCQRKWGGDISFTVKILHHSQTNG